MNKFIATAAALTILATGGANAAPIYATSVTAMDGTGPSTCTVAAKNNDRTDICNALGAPDGDSTGGFVSSGNYFSLTFGFDQYFTTPISVFEISFGTPASYQEFLDISFSVVAGGIETFGTILNTSGTAVTNDRWEVTVDFGATGGPYSSIIVSDNSGTADGFDIDAMGVTPVPLPAGGLLLLTGFGALALRRRRKAA